MGRRRPELTAQALVEWADERRIDLHYIQPGKPDQNAYIERFNRTYRTEVLDAHLFESLAEVRALTARWLVVYNQERPHDSLGRVPPLYRLRVLGQWFDGIRFYAAASSPRRSRRTWAGLR